MNDQEPPPIPDKAEYQSDDHEKQASLESKAKKPKKPRIPSGNPRKATRKSHTPLGYYEVARLGAFFTHAGFFRSSPKQKNTNANNSEEPTGIDNNGPADSDSKEQADSTTTQQAKPIPRRKHPDAIHGIYKSPLTLKKPFRGDAKAQPPLTSADEEVLIALLAIAGVKIRQYVYKPSADPRRCLDENVCEGNVVAVVTNRSEIAKLLGWGINPVVYEAIFHSLVRLRSCILQIPCEKVWTTTRIIGFPEDLWDTKSDPYWIPAWKPRKPGKPKEKVAGKQIGEAAGESEEEVIELPAPEPAKSQKWLPKGDVEVVICQHLSEIILNPQTKSPYGLHLLSERLALGTLGRTIYSQLVAQVRPGQNRLVHLDSILEKLKNRPPEPNERAAAIKALTRTTVKKGKNLNWRIVVLGRKDQTYLRVIRPKLPFHLQRWEDKRAAIEGNEERQKPSSKKSNKNRELGL